MKKLLLPILLISLLLSCRQQGGVRSAFSEKTPFESYKAKLEKAALDSSAMGMRWLNAREQALADSLTFEPPFSETVFFKPENTDAFAYYLSIPAGRKVHFSFTSDLDPEELFIELFAIDNNDFKLHSSYSKEDSLLSYEENESSTIVLIVQPALLAQGYLQLTVSDSPAYGFPVLEGTDASIRSFFGMDRDGGSRRHEGVDIFAARGTPVIAPVSGLVSRVGENRLGGNVVWLADSDRKLSLYFAHLDEQLVRSGQRVRAGDTLGLVGNTGNARTTPTHLHFGIYKRGYGAIDPLTYINNPENLVSNASLDTANFDTWHRVNATRLNFRSAPEIADNVTNQLLLHHPLRVVGKQGEWLKVKTKNDATGYVSENLVAPAVAAIEVIDKENNSPLNNSAIIKIWPSATIDVVAATENERLLFHETTGYYWIEMDDES